MIRSLRVPVEVYLSGRVDGCLHGADGVSAEIGGPVGAPLQIALAKDADVLKGEEIRGRQSRAGRVVFGNKVDVGVGRLEPLLRQRL